MNFYTPTLAESIGGENTGTTVIVLIVLLFVMQFATMAKGLFAKKEHVELKQPVAIEGGGEPLRTINEKKFSERYTPRHEHENLAQSLLRLENAVKENTKELRQEIKETQAKAETRIADTHERINDMLENISTLAGEVRARLNPGPTRAGAK